LDIFGILRLPQDEYIFPRKAIKEIIEQLQTRLFLLEKQEKIRLDPEIFLDAPSILKNGIQNLGIFHTEKPLVFNKDGNIISTNFRVLYFYHNRLQHYHLDRFVQWKMEEIEVLKFD